MKDDTPRTSRLRFTDNKSGEVHEHVAQFTEEEWRQLHEYLGHVADLSSTQFVANGRGVQLNFNWTQGTAPSWSVKAPPEDEVLAFLHRLRPLILQSEPASFLKVRALLNRRLRGAPIQMFMDWLLEVYEGKDMQKLIVMQSNDRIMNSEEMLVTWLNAYEYHRDRDKQTTLEKHSHVMPFDWSRGVFLNLLIEKAKSVANLGVLVELVIGKRDTLSVTL